MTATVDLASGTRMPALGLGTWPMGDDDTERAVLDAARAGYRLFDTAENYHNERGVGRGLRGCGVPREELFVTTKFNRAWHGEELVRSYLEASMKRLQVEYVDLLLIHWPNPSYDRYVQAWRGLIQLRDEGLVRAIGVSNFKPAHLERLREETGVLPEVNQVQLHPYVTRPEERAYHFQHGIVTESWGPLGRGDARLLQEPVITTLAEQYGKTPAQIVLRWHLELGLVPIPKTSSPERMRENLEVFDFALARDEVAAISALDDGSVMGVDSDVSGH